MDDPAKSMSAFEITQDLLRRLRARYHSRTSGYVMLQGVGNGAGFGNNGWSDAIAMQTWPSKGLATLGFEVKATRSDWKRELNKPEKNAEWQDNCDEWYVVAPKGVVELAELPTAWGLMIPKGADGLQIAKRCERPVGRDPISRELLAAVFRAAGTSLSEALQALKNEIHKEERAAAESRIAKVELERSEIQGKYNALTSALGCYSFTDIDKLVATAKLVNAASHEEIRDRAGTIVRQLKILTKDIEEAIA